MTIETAINKASRSLENAGIDQPVREARLLLAFVLDRPDSFIFAHPERELGTAEAERFGEAVRRRSLREPFHYIVGKREFYGLEFFVNADVLIPRPETEILVEEAKRTLGGLDRSRFFEVGTGSGCIAISILTHVRAARGIASDISAEAIKVARANAAKHNVSDRVDFLVTDVFDAIGETRSDLVVSNPPYIAQIDMEDLQKEVRGNEPIQALTDGMDGTRVLERIIRGAPVLLRPGGRLLLEIGAGQAGTVQGMFDEKIWEDVHLIEDLQGIPRVISGRKEGRRQ